MECITKQCGWYELSQRPDSNIIQQGTERHKLTVDVRGSGPKPLTVSIWDGATHSTHIGPWYQQHVRTPMVLEQRHTTCNKNDLPALRWNVIMQAGRIIRRFMKMLTLDLLLVDSRRQVQQVLTLRTTYWHVTSYCMMSGDAAAICMTASRVLDVVSVVVIVDEGEDIMNTGGKTRERRERDEGGGR